MMGRSIVIKVRIRGPRKGPQLFHLRVDPHEKRNVADLYPDQVQTMVESLAQWYPVMERQTLTRTR